MQEQLANKNQTSKGFCIIEAIDLCFTLSQGLVSGGMLVLGLLVGFGIICCCQAPCIKITECKPIVFWLKRILPSFYLIYQLGKHSTTLSVGLHYHYIAVLWDKCCPWLNKKNARRTAAIAGQENFAYWNFDEQAPQKVPNEEGICVQVNRKGSGNARDTQKEFKVLPDKNWAHCKVDSSGFNKNDGLMMERA